MPTLTEAELITQAVLDYFEGWFEGDPVRMERALHPDLVKRRSGEELGVTTKEMMVEATERGAGKGIAAEAVVEIEIHDGYDDIASVTVQAEDMTLSGFCVKGAQLRSNASSRVCIDRLRRPFPFVSATRIRPPSCSRWLPTRGR